MERGIQTLYHFRPEGNVVRLPHLFDGALVLGPSAKSTSKSEALLGTATPSFGLFFPSRSSSWAEEDMHSLSERSTVPVVRSLADDSEPQVLVREMARDLLEQWSG